MSSIYSELKKYIEENGKMPKNTVVPLADHSDIEERYRDSWVPGSFEADILRSFYDFKPKTVQCFMLSRAVQKQIVKPCDKNRDNMVKKLSKYYAISYADPVLSFLTKSVYKADMRIEALRMIKESEKREIVKFGIALLGYSGTKDDVDVLKFIAQHDEFTLFAVRALENIVPKEDYDSLMVEIAESTSGGFGKVAAIFEISASPADNVREWLLEKGAAVSCGEEYVACECAVKGCLVYKLHEIAGLEREDKNSFIGKYKDGICAVLNGLLKAEDTKNLDGLSEVDGILGAVVKLKEITADSDYADDVELNETFKKFEKYDRFMNN
ncbi:MAG: hypothetical protein E7384_04465 [Ruminococcaceae bacterium]|nr:hypothetical protein [Oscillospiraceae bacterium]